MTASVEEKKSWDDDVELAPDSSVRPTAPPPSRRAVAIGSIRAQAPSTMSVTLTVAVSPGLMAASGAGGWYLTVTRTEGTVLYEGLLDELGTLDAIVSVPCGTRALKVLLESATKYKDAIVAVRDDGTAAHTFF